MIKGVNQTKEWISKYKQSFLTIDCGDWSYGSPMINLAVEDNPRKLTIGRYCSIATEVAIHVGNHGRHLLDTISSYPLEMVVSAEAKASGDVMRHFPKLYEPSDRYKGSDLDVEIGHDVWIGTRALIMPGVKIGTGAVIGACAVVTKDVAPYEIVGGVPAKHIRYRHSPETIERLLNSKWWELEPDEIWNRSGSLFSSRRVADVLDLIQSGGPSPLEDKLGKLLPDLSNSPQVLRDLSLDELYQAFSGSILQNFGLPRWPSEELQARYTGASGVPLLKRAKNFIDVLAAEGEFDSTIWRGLDFGVGWGRLASYMLNYGTPEQLDICDAWAHSLKLSKDGGLKNSAFLVGEQLSPSDIQSGAYDFIYAFSIFTHLSSKIFLPNIKTLMLALKPGGRLYLTVRHEDFFPSLERLVGKLDLSSYAEEGFVHITYPQKEVYGETVVSPEFMRTHLSGLGKLVSLGTPDILQHLYRITRTV